MKFWTDFAEKHPSAAKWIREGGLCLDQSLRPGRWRPLTSQELLALAGPPRGL